MKQKKIHYFIDWFVIIFFIFFIVTTMTTHSLWERFSYIAPPYIFIALCLLFLNHISIKNCFQTRDVEFLLVCGGIILSGVNIILIKSNIGAFFTVANFLLIFYLANKVHFDKIQVCTIAFTSFLILLYWVFINKETHDNHIFNPNGISLMIFSNFCVVISFSIYFLSSFRIPKWIFHIIFFVMIYIITKRILSLNCRGVLLAIIAWVGTYYILPKNKYTIPFVFGCSLLMPVIYVLLWKSGAVNGIFVLGKRFASGRDKIWYEFFKVFIHHPITGIGSNFDVMIPDLYCKEVHHALLDLLFVHGLPVFLIILYLMYKRIGEVILSPSKPVKAVCLASIYGILTASSFENYCIVSPHNVLFLTIFIISYITNDEYTVEER